MNRIKELREAKGLMQKELARLAHVSSPFLHDLEANHRGAKPETMKRIAEALGCTMEDILKEDNDGKAC